MKLLESNMDTTYEISKLFQYCAKRHAHFKQIKADIFPETISFRILRPTRWTIRNETFHSIIDNYEARDEILNNNPNSDTKAKPVLFCSIFFCTWLCNILTT